MQNGNYNFNISKCKYIHYGKNHTFGGYNINGQPLTSVDYRKDLGVTFDCNLNFHQQTSEVALKANRVLACMERAFVDLNCDVFLKLYKALVRPIMEYANIIWGPHFLLDKRKLEGVQGCATKLIPQLRDKSYQYRLISLDLPSLHYRNIRGELIFLYKLINGYFILDFSTFLLYPLMFKPEEIHCSFINRIPISNADQIYFCIRTINQWNQLPDEIIRCNNLNSFKSAIDNYFNDNKNIFL